MEESSEGDSDCTFGEPGSPPSTDFSSTIENESSCSSASVYKEEKVSRSIRYSRRNTPDEKRKMRNARKKRKRKSVNASAKKLKNDLKHTEQQLLTNQKLVKHYRQMSRTYWERWRWELQKRRENMLELRSRISVRDKVKSHLHFHEIDPAMLEDPSVDGKRQEVYIGRGSFGIVRLQIYRGNTVAVKELLPRTMATDVIHEAHMLSLLCHPNVPYLYGVCTKSQPLRLVMQFYGTKPGSYQHASLWKELKKPTVQKGENVWIMLCAQLIEAVKYLHEEVNIIHNDITPTNLLLSASTESSSSLVHQSYQLTLVDFGKATLISEAKFCHLTESEKVEYTRKYPYIAPEVIAGETARSKRSDIFSVGGVLFNFVDADVLPSSCVSQIDKLAIYTV